MTMTFKTYHGLLDKSLQGISPFFEGKSIEIDTAIRTAQSVMKNVVKEGGKVFFVGNGGSAAIASHMALDYTKAKGIKSQALNDPVALTAWSNDTEYAQVFSRQLEMHANEKDMLVAISSSGNSKNIINAVEEAKHQKMFVITLSGFSIENDLLHRGDLNFFVPSRQYGFVELSHHIILHCILDIIT